MCWIVSIGNRYVTRPIRNTWIFYYWFILIVEQRYLQIIQFSYSTVSIMFCPMFSLNWNETCWDDMDICSTLSDPCIIAKFCRVGITMMNWQYQYRLFQPYSVIKEERKEGRDANKFFDLERKIFRKNILTVTVIWGNF